MKTDLKHVIAVLVAIDKGEDPVQCVPFRLGEGREGRWYRLEVFHHLIHRRKLITQNLELTERGKAALRRYKREGSA